MKVVTIATDPGNPFLTGLLAPSCAAHGLDLTVLRPETPAFRMADKRAILGRYLAGLTGRDELVLFTDAYDTMFVRGERYLTQAYARLGHPVVFSGELNSWPLGVVGLALHGGPPVGRYPYLNSGGFIGPVGVLADLLDRYPEPPAERFALLRHLRAHGYGVHRRYGWSDQYHWTLVRLLETDTIAVDHEATIFECFGPPIPDVLLPEVRRSVEDFRAHGALSVTYQRELARLRARLRTPSRAAQVHFAGPVTKAVVLDLYAAGELPGWLTGPARALADAVPGPGEAT